VKLKEFVQYPSFPGGTDAVSFRAVSTQAKVLG